MKKIVACALALSMSAPMAFAATEAAPQTPVKPVILPAADAAGLVTGGVSGVGLGLGLIGLGLAMSGGSSSSSTTH
jgi:hypothetical protein